MAVVVVQKVISRRNILEVTIKDFIRFGNFTTKNTALVQIMSIEMCYALETYLIISNIT